MKSVLGVNPCPRPGILAVLLVAAVLGLSLPVLGLVSQDMKKFSAEASFLLPPAPVPVSGPLALQPGAGVRGRDFVLTFPPVLDVQAQPLANFILAVILEKPDGSQKTYYLTTDSQGVATLTISAADMNVVGQYHITVSGDQLTTTSTEFMVLEPKKGGVAVGPNPFAPTDPVYNQVRFLLDSAESGGIALEIFRLDGAKVFSREYSSFETVFWNGRDFQNQYVPGGIYLWQLKNGSRHVTGSVVVVR